MSKIKVSELFASIQGEGRYAGVPSIFLRTFGCNFRCKSFGHTHGTKFEGPNPEVAEIIKNIDLYKGKKFEELPLVNTGCDTYAAVYPEFKDFSPMMTVEEIVDKMEKILDGRKFGNDFHLIITGGEPLLPGWQKSYPALLEEIFSRDLVERSSRGSGFLNVTFETNGTQELVGSFYEWINRETQKSQDYIDFHFSVSPKMMASGESREDSIKPDIIESYYDIGAVDLKFVVDDEESVKEVKDLVDEHQLFKYSVYLMPEGGTNEAYQKNQRKVADLAMKNGFRFSPRLQCIIYGNEWNT